MIEIEHGISVSDDCLYFKFSRSSGPGGQNVNKLSTRVTLIFDIDACDSFSDMQKKQIKHKLAKRVTKDGMITVSSQQYRTQGANRNAAARRLAELLRDALKTKTLRKKTKIPYGAIMRRIERKKRRGLLKRQRAWKQSDQGQ